MLLNVEIKKMALGIVLKCQKCSRVPASKFIHRMHSYSYGPVVLDRISHHISRHFSKS